jgi:hypothetical protein
MRPTTIYDDLQPIFKVVPPGAQNREHVLGEQVCERVMHCFRA